MDINEAKQALTKIELKKRHSKACQQKNGVKDWDVITDVRAKRSCFCAWWACGTWPGEGFDRKATKQTDQEQAEAVVLLWLTKADYSATIQDENSVSVEAAIADYMQSIKDTGAKLATILKYQNLFDQLQAFADWKGLKLVRALNQNVMLEFKAALADAAGYKKGAVNARTGKARWAVMAEPTIKRAHRTLKYFFARGIDRKFVTEDPTKIWKFAKENHAPVEDENGEVAPPKHVKHLTPEQIIDIKWSVSQFLKMSEYHKQRLLAFILVLEHTGLRMSDAVLLRDVNIKGDVLYKVTKKASVQVQIPLHPELAAALATLTPYAGGYLFWERRDVTTKGNPATVQGNYAQALRACFDKAGLTSEVLESKHVGHMFRHTFAVNLLEKGVPMDVVSLMLGHRSIATTERFYANYTKKYMERAEGLVRAVWA